MIAIDSPAIVDGLEAWENHLKRLENMPEKFQQDKMLKSAKERALRIIYMFENYPDGIDLKTLNKTELKKILKIFKD